MKYLTFSLLFLSCAALAAEEPLSPEERFRFYEESGFEVAKKLYTDPNNNGPEEELHSRKADALNASIRDKSIRKNLDLLARTKDKNLRLTILKRLSQLYNTQAELQARRADIRDKDGVVNALLEKSNAMLMRVMQEYPNSTPDVTRFAVAENYSKLKNLAKAEQYYRNVIRDYPKSSVRADALLALGNLYFEKQLFQAARGEYRKILDTEEQTLHPYAHYKIAWCFFNENSFQEAVAALESSIRESRKLSQNSERKLGVEDEALSDLILFFAEVGNPLDAKDFFEKIVNKEQAKEMRFQLARRLFDNGKHEMAKAVARDVLADNPGKEYTNKLYLILISVADRTKDRNLGLKTAEQLSSWIKKENLPSKDVSRLETEEYLRLYSQKLHHEAETLKEKELWEQARKSYEIYLETFPDEPEVAEVKFRYAVLLMNRKQQLKAYQAVSEAIAKMDAKNSRYQDALKLRIQSIELATKDERKSVPDKNLIVAYDEYAKAFPKDELSTEAEYKAAELAKSIETPEQVAARFRHVAEKDPKHRLAKASLAEALAVLVKAERWDALRTETAALITKSDLHKELGDAGLEKKITEAQELAMVKLSEKLESEGKFAEAGRQYENFLTEKHSDTMNLYSLVRLTKLNEEKLGRPRESIKNLQELRKRFPASKEGKQATLELARLYEQVNEPREAIREYMDFAASGKDDIHSQAMRNAGVLLESLGDRPAAAQIYFQLSDRTKKEADRKSFYEAACRNVLLGSYQDRSPKLLRSIHDCSKTMAANGGEQSLLWQARAAWALDQMAEELQSHKSWEQLAKHKLKGGDESTKAYVAMAKVRLLRSELDAFKAIKFTRTNEKPTANIGKKSQAMDALEKHVTAVISNGTPRQILQAQKILQEAYNDFADTMENAALPSKLSEQEKTELKKSFLGFADEFKAKAKALDTAQPPERTLASTAMPEKRLEIPTASENEKDLVHNGKVSAELFAKMAAERFQKGNFQEARYFAQKWRQSLEKEKSGGAFGLPAWEKFEDLLSEHFPDQDPLAKEF